jgi:pimeloyl-ACP methyl ester carboxylesterase
MASQPLVYILHGAWHGPAYFETVKGKLQALGYTMLCPQQPSTGASPPTKTLHDDAAVVRAELELLIEHGQEVVLVMHSYGGMVGTQAAAGLGKAERTKQGKTGGVVRLLYACSFLLPLGSDLCKSLGGSFPPWIKEEVRAEVVPASVGR